jgi:hypothetical protein
LRDTLNLCGIVGIFPVDEAKRLLCGKRCIAYLLEELVADVVAMRDSLVRLGACGALIIERRGDTFMLPPLEDPLEKYDTSLAEALRTYVRQATTAVVVCGETFSDTLGLIELKCSKVLNV